jgi:CubicO group peptidase (beta-lactamase class C family)
MKKIIIVFSLLTCTFCFGQKANKIAIDSFENVIKKDVSNKIIAGGTYLLYQKGKIIASNTFGENDINTHVPLKRTDIFRMASMTKPITSLGLLLLQQDGWINMNDRLDQYIPEFANPVVLDRIDTLNGVVVLRTHPAKNPILLRNLLTHSSGFASSFYPSQKAIYDAVFKDVELHDLKHFSHELAKIPLDFEPGENWQYGPSINVAARVIEIVSGMSFNDFLNKRILEPMQMKDTKFYLDSTDAQRLTSLYTLDNKGAIQLTDPGNLSSQLISGPKIFYSGSGGINSTMDDYLKFCIMILKNGIYENKIIAKPETIALMKMDQLPLNVNGAFSMPTGKADAGFTYGYQIIRREGISSPLSEKTISWAGAYGTRFFIDPKREIIAIYLTQNDEYSQVPSWVEFYNWMQKALN